MFIKFAYRYLVSKKSTNAINIIAWVSITAIALVTGAMIVIMSVFNGLTDLVKSLYNGFYTDLKILPKQGKILKVTESQFEKLSKLNNVAVISKVAEEKALIKIGENQTVVTLKGVDSNFKKITNIADKIIRNGKYQFGDTANPYIILGYGIENALGIMANPLQSGATLYIPDREHRFTGKMEDFRTGTAKPIATFAIQQDFDNKYVLSDLSFAKNVIGLDSAIGTQIELSIKDNNNLETTKRQIETLLGNDVVVQTRFEQNKSLFSVMRNEKWAAYAIFCLVLFIASFTIIGSLTMLVLEKKKDIGILKSMGASNSLVKNIFLTEGFVLGVVGIFLGAMLGLLLCFLQEKFHIVKLSGGSFLVDHYPVRVAITDVLLILATVLVIAIVAGWFPAQRAAKQQFNLKN